MDTGIVVVGTARFCFRVFRKWGWCGRFDLLGGVDGSLYNVDVCHEKRKLSKYKIIFQ
jgi:hypothetical protein